MSAPRWRSLYAELAHPDRSVAARGRLELAALADGERLSLLRGRLIPASRERIERLLLALDDASFRVRDEAFSELAGLGVESELVRLVEAGESWASRAAAILPVLTLAMMSRPARDRSRVAIDELARLGDGPAIVHLRTLADGLPAAGLTELARRALDRFDEAGAVARRDRSAPSVGVIERRVG